MGRIPLGLLKSHNRVGAILADLSVEDAVLILVDHVEMMGLQGTEAWARFMDRHRKRTGTRPEPDRNQTGNGPEPDRNQTGTRPEPDRNQTGKHPVPLPSASGDLPDLGGGGASLSPDSSSPTLPSSEADSRGNVPVATARGEVDDVSFVMTLEWELDDETRAAASMLGLKDVGAAWLAFRAHQLDKPPRTRRAWLALFRDVWAPRARNFASTDAARAGGGKRGRSVQQANPAGAAWLREPEVDPLAEPGAPPSPAKVAGAR